MDERFGEWLRDALADVDDDLLKRRWSGVEALGEELGASEIMELILYCTNGVTSDSDTIKKARRVFWEHDNAFRMGDNDFELQRLSGSVVIHALERESATKMNFALASVCLYFGGCHSKFGFPALAEEAEKTLQKLSVSIRSEFPTDTMAHRVIWSNKITAKIKQRIEEGQAHLPIADVQDIYAQYGRGLNQLAGDNAKLQWELRLQREETDILWWLTSAFSNDLEAPFASFPSDVASVIAGKELADLVSHYPGPLSAAHILQRMILNSANQVAEASLKEIVAQTPMSWRQKLGDETDGEVLRYCPILTAMVQSAFLYDDPGWVTLFSKNMPHSPNLHMSPSLFGYQMYRERMLSRNLGAKE